MQRYDNLISLCWRAHSLTMLVLLHLLGLSCHRLTLWNRSQNRHLLFSRFNTVWPTVRRCPANKYGSYFYRLTTYGCNTDVVNQLDYIIETWNRGNKRRSALQASIVDPAKDSSHSRQRGFPCLQQVSFLPIGQNGKEGLEVIAYYPTQFIFEKAYGNYLGLYRLGDFMAHEMQLRLHRVTCIVIRPLIGKIPKRDLQHFYQSLKQLDMG